MKTAWIALAMMVACGAWGQSQSPSPAPTKESRPVQKTTQNKGRTANNDQRGTEQRPLFVTVSGVSVVEVQGGPKAEQKPAETANKENNGPTLYGGLPADAWTALFTGALVFIGFVTGAVLICQSVLLRRQVNLARDEFNTTARAFVFLDGFNTLLFTVEDRSGPGETDRSPSSKLDNGLITTFFSFQPRWKNAGNTPTKNMITRVNWRPLKDPLGPDFDFAYQDRAEHHFLGPQAIETSVAIKVPPTYVTNVIEFENAMPSLASVGSNEYANLFRSIIIWGRADYLDVFDKPHFTEWCYRIGFSRPPGQKLSASSFTQCSEYNRTDHDGQECPNPRRSALLFS